MDTNQSPPAILTQTYELGRARLRLRSDLRFTLHNDQTSDWYLVEDESNASFYRVGVTEYAFLSLLNGHRTLDEAIAKLASLSCCDDLDEGKAASLARWVIDSGLAETPAAKSLERIEQQRSRERSEATAQWMNPIAVRVPLFNPDQLLSRLYGNFRWMAGWPLLVIWLVVCLSGAIALCMAWEEFWSNQIRSLSHWDFLWFACSWMVLKSFHEAAHGLVCKHYGGLVPEVGILMLLLIPLPFVDVSSAWGFPGKSKRILTSAAGVLAETLIAAVAILVWVNSGPGPIQYHMGNLIIAATINTLLFNVNPLMKLDGYYILSDWSEIPNLYTRGRTFVKQSFKWIFFGVPFDVKTEPSMFKVWVVRSYGLLALAWFALICVTLAAAAASLLSGIGLLVALAASVLWLGVPTVNLIKYFWNKQETESRSRIRFLSVSGLGTAFLLGAAFGLPSPGSIRAPIVIVEDDVSVVRIQAAGFVRQVHVEDRQYVRQGETIATLSNPQLISEIGKLESDIAASELRANVFKNDGDLATWQIENETLEGLLQQWRELVEQQSQLTVIAPISGVVNSPDLPEFLNVYLEQGEELITIMGPGSKHAVAMVAQRDAVWLRENETAKSARIRLWGSGQAGLVGEIETISPKATDRVPHFSFASNNGGPLSVVNRQQVDASISEYASGMQLRKYHQTRSRTKSLLHFAAHRSSVSDRENVKLTRQYVPVKIVLSEKDSRDLAIGQAGYMITGGRNQSMGDYVWQNFRRWIASQIRLTHGL